MTEHATPNSTFKRDERKVASKNEDLIKEDPELVKSDAKGKADADRLRDLDSKRKDDSVRQLIEWDLNAQNGPQGAQPHDPKPPYWDLKNEKGDTKVDWGTVDKVFDLIEENQEEQEEAAEKDRVAAAKRHDAEHERKDEKTKRTRTKK